MRWRNEILLLLASAIAFLPFLGVVHLFDWDEINFAESAREMLITQNWFQVQINFEPFWEKPPFFFWLQAISMKIFGVGEFAARLPNALCGMATLQTLYAIGRKQHNTWFAWMWVALYAGSFLPHLYFKSGIIDPWFNLFIFLSIYFFYRSVTEFHKVRLAAIAGVFSGMAILTKGPVGLLLLILTVCVWWGFNRFQRFSNIKSFLAFGMSALMVSFLWFGYETISNGPWFLVEFVKYQIDLFLNPVAGHKQPFFYHFVVVLIGCFPMSILAIPAFYKSFEGDANGFSRWMKYLFWVVMILFSIVTTKIVHYSSMAYIPLSYLATLVLLRLEAGHALLKRWQRIWMLSQGLIIALALTLVPLLILWRDKWLHLIDDPFVRGNLEAPLSPKGFEWLVGLIYFGMVVWSFLRMRRSAALGVRALALGTAFLLFGAMPLAVPLVEGISQRSAIAFFEAQQGKEVYFETYGYKSYAHYFYGRINPETAHHADKNALDQLDKVVMVSCKITHKSKFVERYPQAELLYEQGGFAFFSLHPPSP